MLYSTAVISGDHDSAIPDQYTSVFEVREHFQFLSYVKNVEAMWLTTTAAVPRHFKTVCVWCVKTVEKTICLVFVWRKEVVHVSEEQGSDYCLLEVIVVFTISIQSLCWLMEPTVYRYQTGRRVFSLIGPLHSLRPDRFVHSKLIKWGFFFLVCFLLSLLLEYPRWFLSAGCMSMSLS